MRIGLFYHQFIRAGGLENYLIEFASRLEAAGHELHIVTSRLAPDVGQKLKAQWHMILRPQFPMLRMWHFNHAARLKLKDLGTEVNLGFGRTTAQDFHRAGGGCHAMYSKLLPWWKRYTAKNLLELALERKLYNGGRTKHFVMNSARVAAQIQGLYPGARDKCSVIYTAVDTDIFKPSAHRENHRQIILRSLSTDMNKPVALFVSLSHRRKGLDTLLQAWTKIDATLWIAGRELDGHYLGMIEKLGLKPKVRAIPPTNNLTDLYQAADWFVHPTLYDACANTVLQSMASGLPGLISVQDGAVDHIRDGENGFMLYHPTDVEELRKRITQAFTIPEAQRQMMGTKAREAMLPLTWEAHVADWMKLIQAGFGK
ncbi:MAG: glycosyltransferase family 4 protein [Verrucomicrobiaceae bacterium]|jgi:glycosyltransferase involved in cell wall biosynthesis